METIEQLKVHYQWRLEEEENLRKLSEFGAKYQQEWIGRLYSYLANFPDTSKYLPNEQVRERHNDKLKKWFVALFAAAHDAEYLRRLYRIGEVHVQIGLPPHYVSASMNFTRQFIYDKLAHEPNLPIALDQAVASVNKILDLNLDVMTGSFREEELKFYLASGRIQRLMIETMRRGLWLVDLFIIAAFAVAGLFLMLWIGYEMVLVATGKTTLEHGAIMIMGSVLILYAISELLNEEIRHLRGAALGLKVFIAVALAAVIRKILILSLEPGRTTELIVLAGLTISLAATHWLIIHAENKTAPFK